MHLVVLDQSDCVRWSTSLHAVQAMIISILFFEMSLSTALWTGIIVGIGVPLEPHVYWNPVQTHVTSTPSCCGRCELDADASCASRAGYTLFVRAMYRQQLAQAAQEAARVAGGGSPSVHAPPPVMHQMIV